MQTKWKKILASAGAALLGASALAVASDSGFSPFETAPETASINRDVRPADGEPCPPIACSIVYKTDAGGPPSRVVDAN